MKSFFDFFVLTYDKHIFETNHYTSQIKIIDSFLDELNEPIWILLMVNVFNKD